MNGRRGSSPVRTRDPPEIEVERSWVHSGEGFEAQLVCIVHSEPPADVLWYRDTLRLDTTERRSMEVRGSRHTLIIRKVQASDFGNYSCVADNSLGKMRQYLQLSGKPNQVVFRSEPIGRYKDSYNITWAVNSYTPIEEFKLYFRKLFDQNQPNPPQQHHAKRPTRRSSGRTVWHSVQALPVVPIQPFLPVAYSKKKQTALKAENEVRA
ncbi:hypothetical protein RUM43_008569 [Polyplax serrata]|uniref:Ig-like domain-containing protein n=1 Tax=Polyplax serrata TaxID=468196 RepID=A0AAN8S0L9_POLSC